MMQSSRFLREFRYSSGPESTAVALVDETRATEAYERGVADGLAQGRAEAGKEAFAVIRELSAKLDDMAAMRDGMAEGIRAEAGQAVAAVIRRICPALAAQGMGERAALLLETDLKAAPRPITIHAAPEIAEALTDHLAERFGPSVRIESVEGIPDTRIDFAWSEGGASVDTGALSDRILALATELAPASAAEQRNSPEEDDSHDRPA